MESEVRSEQETIRFGETYAKGLSGGDVLALVGDLGAGKTHLVKGVCRGLGVEAEVRSPTFGLVHEYFRRTGGRVCHFDWYRLEVESELWEMGWDEYLVSEDILLIEWADRFPDAVPARTRWLHLSHGGADEVRVIRTDHSLTKE